jgi:murein DD-endopeptidase MepM/ murein hydrolase activator NlpD
LVVSAVAAVGLLFGTVALAPCAPADSVSDRKQALDRRLANLRETLEGTSKSLVDAAVNLRRAQSDLVDANAKLGTARSALAAATARDDVLAGELAVASAAVAKAQRDLDARQHQEAETRARLGGIARETYVSSGSSGLSGLSIALNAESPAQFADRINVAGTALQTQNGAIDRLEVQQAETRARQSRLAAAQSEVADLKSQSEVVLGQREAAEQAAVAATAEVSKLVTIKIRSVRTIAARRGAERRRLAALQVQESRLRAILRKRARTGHGVSFGNGSGRLSYPVNAPITSGFGERFHPILHIWRLHAGTDFGASCGTPVHAAAAGRVVRAGRAGGFGNQLVIDHGRMRGRDIATSYNHLSRFVVRSGRVRRGQVVAYSGTTGLSTGCHLHFEVYVNGTHVNPMGWL